MKKIFFFVLSLFYINTYTLASEIKPSLVYDQNRWHHLSQGSELYPFRFFKSLYIVKDQKLFSKNLERFGFIEDKVSEANPDAVPIGMTVAPTADLAFAGIRMIGINCSACHTTLMTKGGNPIPLIDGGQNLFDIRGFIGALATNTKETFSDPDELIRFTNRLATDLLTEQNPNSFTFRIIEKGGDRLLRNFTTFDEFAKRGALEKVFAELVKKMIADELRKPPPVLNYSFSANVNQNALKEYEKKVKGIFGTTNWLNPDLLNKQSMDLQNQILGDLRSNLPDFNQFESLIRTSSSPLQSLNEEGRRLEVKTSFGNILKTLRLLRARYEFIINLVGKDNDSNQNTDPLPGRVDAFGSARNAMFPHSPVPLTAPVSYPHLWNLKETHWYHWDGNTTSKLERNVGEAIGVGVIYSKEFDSTIRIKNIEELEDIVTKIPIPLWPQDILGKPDAQKVTRGKGIFKQYCTNCHEARSNPNANGLENPTDMIPIGTDSMRADNFAIPLENKKFVDHLSPLLKSIIRKNAGTTNDQMNWRTTQKYDARSLKGIWASPPYLHNGSVPSIYELLLPEEQRIKIFAVGIREYDSVKLGYNTIGDSPMMAIFDTKLKGNSNKGHSGTNYGTLLSQMEKDDLIEFLKTY